MSKLLPGFADFVVRHFLGDRHGKGGVVVDPLEDGQGDIPEFLREWQRAKGNATKVRERAPDYKGFGEAVYKLLRDHHDWFSDEWCEEVMPLAVAAGLAQRVEFDPAIHGEICNAEPGDEIWIWAEDVRPTAQEDVSE